MKTKIAFALVAFLMLGSVNLNAQENGNTQNSESTTSLEGDLNRDGKVDAADITYLVNIIMKNKDGGDRYFWYLSNEPLTSDNVPHDIQAQDAEDHKGWRELDPNTDRLEIPYVETDDLCQAHWCIAVPASLGFNTIVNTANIDITNQFNPSNITVDNVEYNVWIMDDTTSKIIGVYLIKSNIKPNPTSEPEPQGEYFWYLSNEALTEDNVPHDIQAQDAEDHKGWRELDPNTNRLQIPYVEMEDRSNVNWCFAVPSSLGFNKIVNTSDMDVTNGFSYSNVTVNNVEYDVWTIIVPVWRISRYYLIK